AKKQPKSDLASTGGRVKPGGRHTLGEKGGREGFQLRPGQLTTLIHTPEGSGGAKWDKSIPADQTGNVYNVKENVILDISERKLQAEMAVVFQTMQKDARLQLLLKKSERGEPGPTPLPNQVVAYINGTIGVTREELGEYLIERYGAEKLEFLVNRRII